MCSWRKYWNSINLDAPRTTCVYTALVLKKMIYNDMRWNEYLSLKWFTEKFMHPRCTLCVYFLRYVSGRSPVILPLFCRLVNAHFFYKSLHKSFRASWLLKYQRLEHRKILRRSLIIWAMTIRIGVKRKSWFQAKCTPCMHQHHFYRTFIACITNFYREDFDGVLNLAISWCLKVEPQPVWI